MRPFTILLGILLGSLVSIAFSLGVVLLVFWILQDEHPRFGAEMPELARAAALFSTGTVLAAAAFVGTLRRRIWRYPLLTMLWVMLGLTAWYYWPT